MASGRNRSATAGRMKLCVADRKESLEPCACAPTNPARSFRILSRPTAQSSGLLFNVTVKLFLMPDKRYWTSYWKAENWTGNKGGDPLHFSGGSFTRRQVSRGDALYVISLRHGQLLLGGRMTVAEIVSRREAIRLRGRSDLYRADEWVQAQDGSGTPLHHSRELAPDVSRLLRFESRRPKLLFVDDQNLDRQTLRAVRELTKESARLLDEIIQFTDKNRPLLPTRVTLHLLKKYQEEL